MSSPSKKTQKQEKNKVAIRLFPIFKCFLKGKTNTGYVGHHHQAAPRAAAANVLTSGLVPRHNGSTHDLVGGFTDSWDHPANRLCLMLDFYPDIVNVLHINEMAKNEKHKMEQTLEDISNSIININEMAKNEQHQMAKAGCQFGECGRMTWDDP